MSGSVRVPTVLGGVLFEEDFDRPDAPPPPSEPEVVEPVFTAEELESARTAAHQEGMEAGRAEALAQSDSIARASLARIADCLAAAEKGSTELAEQAAEAIARLVLDGFAAAFPALCRRHGATELRALIQAITPALHQEPAVTIRVGSPFTTEVADEIARLDPDLIPRLQVVPSDAIAPGDIRVTWRNGAAVRDTAALWSEIEDILAPAGLLPSPAAVAAADGSSPDTVSAPAAPATDQSVRTASSPIPPAATKEIAHVE